MPRGHPAERLATLPRQEACGVLVPVAVGFRARLLGLAWLDLAEAGVGLLIPGCRSVHTFGMRFSLDLLFLDARGEVLCVRRGVGPHRAVRCRGAVATLELPTEQGGEFGLPRGLGGHASRAHGVRHGRGL